jgi:hypothetical protein
VVNFNLSMPEFRLLSLGEVAHALSRDDVEISDQSPLASLDLEHHPKPAEPLTGSALEALRILASPQRRLGVIEQLNRQEHTFFVRGDVSTQVLWGDDELALALPEPLEQLTQALARKATSSTSFPPVALSPLHLLALSMVFKKNGQVLARRARAEANTLVSAVQLIDDLLELQAITFDGRDLMLTPSFSAVLQGFQSGDVISIERADFALTQVEQVTHASIIGPVGKRFTATDVSLHGRSVTAFVWLDAAAAQRWAAQLVGGSVAPGQP